MRWAIATLLSTLASPAATNARLATLDHVILGVPDLEQAVAEFEARTGVKPAIGGSHPGRGTRNALVSLGDGTYLEIIAPDPSQQSDLPMVVQLLQLTRPTLVGWAIGTSDPPALKRRLERSGIRTDQAEPGGRVTPNGTTLRWETFGAVGLDRDSDPFFIRWFDPASHPSRSAPKGCSLVSFTTRGPGLAPLGKALLQLNLPVRAIDSKRQSMSLSIHCPKGRMEFR